MKDNYYSLKNTKRVKKKNLYSKQQSNYRKRKARKLNYKKVFIFFITIFAIFYLSITGITKLFSNRNNQKTAAVSTEINKDVTINMAVIGDIMCHTTNFYDAYDSKNDTYDFSKVFTDIQSYIKSADIAIGNLETTFAGKDIGYTGYPTFNTPEQLAQNLVDLGLDVVSTANNHSLDKRYSGLVSTLDELDKVRSKSYWNL